MRLGPLDITKRKAAVPITNWLGTWMGGNWPWVREAFAGAWQRGVTRPVEDALTHPTFFACVTLIAADIAKLRPMLVSLDAKSGIETEVSNPAYSPVLAKPNHYQNRIQFLTYWMLSKLNRGNAYALKVRDARNVVTDLYLLDPMRVRPLVGPTGEVFYALGQDLLNEVSEQDTVVPAREIIHDVLYPLYHPLVGLSPVYAAGHAAGLSLDIMRNTEMFAKNGSMIGGLLVAPGQISKETADRLEALWNTQYAGPQNAGKVAVIGDGMKYEKPNIMSAVDAQIIDQLKWNDEKICAVFHVPPFMVGVGALPAYNNVEALAQQYYSQCLQYQIEAIELCLSEGLSLADPYCVELDLEGLLRMDSVQQMETATKGVVGGVYSPNEARARFNLPPVKGGESPYLQQQNYSLADLAKRSSMPPAAPPIPGGVPPPVPPVKEQAIDEGEVLTLLLKKLAA
jgi:HK97 family phage portal protein